MPRPAAALCGAVAAAVVLIGDVDDADLAIADQLAISPPVVYSHSYQSFGGEATQLYPAGGGGCIIGLNCGPTRRRRRRRPSQQQIPPADPPPAAPGPQDP